MYLENGLFFPVISANLTQSHFCRSSQLQLHHRCSNSVQFQVFKKTEKNQYFASGAGDTVESRAPLNTLLAFSEAGGGKALRSRAQGRRRSLQIANQHLCCCRRIPALPHLEHLQLAALHLFLWPSSWSSAAVPAKDITATSLHFQCPGIDLRRVQEQASSCLLPAGEPTASISGTERASSCSDVEYPACEDVRTTNPSSRLQSGQATAVQNSHIAHCGYY